jgi:rhomboid family GlyGly-CTERM serine protease
MGSRANRLPHPKWLICAAISLLAFGMSWWPGAIQQFRYDRNAILVGEVWRLVTGHLVHLNMTHLLINLIGLFLLCELLWDVLPLRHGVGILLATMLGASLMLWWLDPAVVWYVGLSGVLHGLWAGCALAGALNLQAESAAPSGRKKGAWGAPGEEVRWLCVGALLLLAVKLASELVAGAELSGISAASRLIGAPVVTVAHRHGALIGLAYVVVWQASRWLRQERLRRLAVQG